MREPVSAEPQSTGTAQAMPDPEASASWGLAVDDVVADKYRIEGLLGEGGMGSVFAAVHVHTGRKVALKWMLPELATTPEMCERFYREARAAGRIDHPNVVGVLDVGEHEGSLFLVMPILHGISFRDALDEDRLDDVTILDVLIQAMRGVAAAHAQGVIHRDLKPDNIFLCEGPDGSMREPKVLDFGISKVSSHDEAVNKVATRTGAVMGTPHYMSLEQVSGAKDVDARADVYAMGVIAYEALTGHLPFDADSFGALILRIGTVDPKAPSTWRPDLPEVLSDVLLEAIARNATNRFPDIRSFAKALEIWSGGIRFELPRSEWSGRFVAQQPTRALGRLDTPERLRIDAASRTLAATPDEEDSDGVPPRLREAPRDRHIEASDEASDEYRDELETSLPTSKAIPRTLAAAAGLLALGVMAYALAPGGEETESVSEPESPPLAIETAPAAATTSEITPEAPRPDAGTDVAAVVVAQEDAAPPAPEEAVHATAPARDRTRRSRRRRPRTSRRPPANRGPSPPAPSAAHVGRTGTGGLSAEEF